MLRPSLLAAASAVLLGWGSLVVPSVLAQELFHPLGHPLEGLPVEAGPQPIYGDDRLSPINRLFRLLYSEQLVPSEIQAQLPAERERSTLSDDQFYRVGWYFDKRPGEPADFKTFGGDVRVSPRKAFTIRERNELRELLAGIATAEQVADQPLLASAAARLLLQWDILAVWWELERADDQDIPLLRAMADAIVALAQDRQTLQTLPSGLASLRDRYAGGPPDSTEQPYYPQSFDPAELSESAWTEVDRKSSRLFDASRSLRLARAFIDAGSRSANQALLEQAHQPEAVVVPPGVQTVLLQQLIAIDRDLQAVVTPLVDEFRVRIATEHRELRSDNPTSSRDGSNHWVFMRTRHGSIRDGVDDFRFVPDTAQALFVEYGTNKHATFAAQCALCHRMTNDGGQGPSGIRLLSRYAKPRPAEPGQREALAVDQMQPVLERLRLRLDSGQGVRVVIDRETPLVKVPARPERTDDQRAEWITRLREQYQRPTEQWPQPAVVAGVSWQELGLLPPVEHPESNPHTPEKQQLGQTLFFDPRLSGSQQLACASCHDPDLAWGDGRTVSFGHDREQLKRNSPSIQNAAHWSRLFWDGRAASLEDQAIQVLLNPSEMHSHEAELVERLSAQPEYMEMFEVAFGSQGISLRRIAEAIACFERTIVGGRSRFDRFVAGKHESLTDAELIGLDLFRREAGCMNCHHGPLFSDNRLHNVGLSYYQRKFEDLGAYAQTGVPQDVGRFRTPSLRNVSRTGPLMHNGLFELPGVLNMYNAGMPFLRPSPAQMDDLNFPIASHLLKPLGLNRQDLDDLQAFLHALEEPKQRLWPPPLPGQSLSGAPSAAGEVGVRESVD